MKSSELNAYPTIELIVAALTGTIIIFFCIISYDIIDMQIKYPGLKGKKLTIMEVNAYLKWDFENAKLIRKKRHGLEFFNLQGETVTYHFDNGDHILRIKEQAVDTFALRTIAYQTKSLNNIVKEKDSLIDELILQLYSFDESRNYRFNKAYRNNELLRLTPPQHKLPY